LLTAQCDNCLAYHVWVGDRFAHPQNLGGPPPNEDLPPDIAADYREAAAIVNLSPRGAAALLRLTIQKLCSHIVGEPVRDLDAAIGQLVREGLRTPVQQALDVVRVTGNNAVHPGQIDLTDDTAMAIALFDLVNLITEAMISEPRRIAEMFNDLPTGAREAIERRDG